MANWTKEQLQEIEAEEAKILRKFPGCPHSHDWAKSIVAQRHQKRSTRRRSIKQEQNRKRFAAFYS